MIFSAQNESLKPSHPCPTIKMHLISNPFVVAMMPLPGPDGSANLLIQPLPH